MRIINIPFVLHIFQRKYLIKHIHGNNKQRILQNIARTIIISSLILISYFNTPIHLIQFNIKIMSIRQKCNFFY